MPAHIPNAELEPGVDAHALPLGAAGTPSRSIQAALSVSWEADRAAGRFPA